MGILCKLFGHKLTVLEDYGFHRKVKCARCKKIFGINDDVHAFVKWDDELERASKQ